MKNKVTIFVGDQELDMFGDEDIVINLSVQNIQDISKVFTDFTQGFSVPASPRNNAIFEHYYRTDIVGGADYRLRAEGYIEINGLVFRYGSIELEGVQMRQNAPYAYDITFYGLLVNLTDLFGDDYLYDLDLSAFNHTYDQETIYSGLTSYALAPVIYPMITPQDVWLYESDNTNNDPNNIYWHNQNQNHGVQYYDLKPAITISAIIDAIMAKYGINLSISGVNAYDLLFMWCHRNAGYMYKDIPTGMPWTKLLAPDNYAAVTVDWWNYTDSTFEPQGATGSGQVWQFVVDLAMGAYTSNYNVGLFVDDVLIAQQTHISNGQWAFNDISVTNGSSVYVAIQPSTNETISIDVREIIVSQMYGPQDIYADAWNATPPQNIAGIVDMSSLMPEQKVTDFLASFCKMFNLVIIPITSTNFLLQTLDDWYASGSDVDLSQYFDITENQVERPQLYKQIKFQYNETGAITGEEYRLTNNVGYGDLRSEFVFDTDEELTVDPQFDQMLFTRLTDQDGGALTNILTGYAITRELETYLGQPFIFYAKETYSISANVISFLDASLTITGHKAVSTNTIWYANASSSLTNGATTYSTNYGADIDPYLLQSVNNSLYNVYWQDYITDLYDPSRRLVRIPAILPLGKILNFDLKNKLLWNGLKWVVNNVQINLTTGKAEFELLNNV